MIGGYPYFRKSPYCLRGESMYIIESPRAIFEANGDTFWVDQPSKLEAERYDPILKRA